MQTGLVRLVLAVNISYSNLDMHVISYIHIGNATADAPFPLPITPVDDIPPSQRTDMELVSSDSRKIVEASALSISAFGLTSSTVIHCCR